MKKITPADIEAARRKADRYIRPCVSPECFPSPAARALTDDARMLARYLFGCPMASEYGGVERSKAIDALAALVGTTHEALAEEFDAQRLALRSAHDLIREKHRPAQPRRRRVF
ncbi:MAG TPA: hypothetical protein P5256_00215 [Beijerinckiaceae bacterium]|nr:hypothetical protein [Hyphomicrobiales bacterium]MCO5088733.1 hypothetical protein [Methylobacteriaceae bacterium]HPG02670.1 hypothetical protein [Rhodoblastus sp.]HRY01519.1 hypothetical protein [Beijerinckiaceae bacterium]